MNAPAAIMGTFVALTPVASRKVVRLHIECAIEEADRILLALGGYPDPANPKHVAVARLNGPAEAKAEPVEKEREQTKFSRLRPSAQAALLCERQAFWKFLREVEDPTVDSSELAAAVVRDICKVTSRSELDRDEEAAKEWFALRDKFDAWSFAG